MNVQTEPQPQAKIAWLPLLAAIVITAAITVDPRLLADASGKADHTAAMALFWAMSAGFTRGVGFIPRHRVLAWLLSTPAVLAGVLLAAVRLL